MIDIKNKADCCGCLSDFTIWDCFTADLFDKSLDAEGTTRVLIHTEKGLRLFNDIKSHFIYTEVTADKLTNGVKEMFKSVNSNMKRNEFLNDAGIMEPKSLFNKYFPVTIKTRAEKSARIMLHKTGIYVTAKRAIKKVIKK